MGDVMGRARSGGVMVWSAALVVSALACATPGSGARETRASSLEQGETTPRASGETDEQVRFRPPPDAKPVGPPAGGAATGPDGKPAEGAPAMTAAEVQQTIATQGSGITGCFGARAPSTPLTVRIVIGKEGTVEEAKQVGPYPSKATSSCVLKQVRTLRFPKPRGVDRVIVNYPFRILAAP